ncbi:MAG: CocE/NonD family hydrolase [Candidatus Nezhaarchaeota archaeon]|nr:CocE/NonD family hydrolase [Candidatus Nezhaarchaeota archaeon]
MERRVSFKSGYLVLEGILHLPSEVKERVPAIVVCHPHPLYGGSMYNIIVEKLCRKLENSGLIALRFNFRGVGSSEGVYDGGVGEVMDVKAALNFLETIDPQAPKVFGIAGYSFGAYVASRAAEDPRVKALALISPPFVFYNFDNLRYIRKPKLIVWGDQDGFVSAAIEEVAGTIAEPKKLILVKGADHFWFGYEDEVSDAVTSFFQDIFKADH